MSHAAPLRLANARLVLPNEVVTGGVLLSEGRIADIDAGASVPAGAIDCGGDYVSPGLIELHTDNLERHMQPRPGVAWPRKAAIVAHDRELAGAGVTTVFDALRVGSIFSNDRSHYGEYAYGAAQDIRALDRAGALKINHLIHLRAEICSETLLDELARFAPEDRIGLVSLMDHTPGQRQFHDIGKMKQYLGGKYGMTEDEFEGHFAHLRRLQATLGPAHAAGAVAAAHRLGAVLASHDDTTEDDAALAAAQGTRIAEFPTTLEAAKACRAAGLAVMIGAPNLLRGGSHSGNVAATELFEAGLLDILSSDYAPASLLMGAVQLGLQSGDMVAGLRRVTAAPAAAADLTDRGRLEIGARADVIRFSLEGDLPILRGVWARGARV